jgi:hypothetical protein
MSNNTYNPQDDVMSVNEWLTETFGEFNAEEYNKLPENLTGYNMAMPGWNRGIPKEEQPRYGMRHTPESIEKMKASSKNQHSPEGLEKISEAQIGRKHSKERILKQQESRAGYRHSEETRKRMSEAQTQRWATIGLRK